MNKVLSRIGKPGISGVSGVIDASGISDTLDITGASAGSDMLGISGTIGVDIVSACLSFGVRRTVSIQQESRDSASSHLSFCPGVEEIINFHINSAGRSRAGRR